MRQGTLGVDSRIYYASNLLTSGLVNIIARVRDPQENLVGDYVLIEMTDPMFAGVYYFDILTNRRMLEGEYAIMIIENGGLGIKTPSTIQFKQPIEVNAMNQLIGTIDEVEELVGEVLDIEELVGFIEDNQELLTGTIDDET